MVGTFVQECFKSGFNNSCRDIEIVGDCMRECIPDTRGSVCKTPLYECSARSWNVEQVMIAIIIIFLYSR